MKKILRLTLILVFVLITLNQIWANLYFNDNILTVIKVAVILAIFEIILKPLIKILLLPINIITLGTIRIVINTLGLYLAVFLLSDFTVENISTTAYTLQGFAIPSFDFKGFMAYLITSLTIGIILNFYNFILSKKVPKK